MLTLPNRPRRAAAARHCPQSDAEPKQSTPRSPGLRLPESLGGRSYCHGARGSNRNHSLYLSLSTLADDFCGSDDFNWLSSRLASIRIRYWSALPQINHPRSTKLKQISTSSEALTERFHPIVVSILHQIGTFVNRNTSLKRMKGCLRYRTTQIYSRFYQAQSREFYLETVRDHSIER